MDNAKQDDYLLIQLILMFQTAAMQQMGKLKSPITEKIEKDLAQAKISIDILDMIQKKTRGNLTKDEEKILSNVLQDLKLNYVDELSREQTETPKNSSDEDK